MNEKLRQQEIAEQQRDHARQKGLQYLPSAAVPINYSDASTSLSIGPSTDGTDAGFQHRTATLHVNQQQPAPIMMEFKVVCNGNDDGVSGASHLNLGSVNLSQSFFVVRDNFTTWRFIFIGTYDEPTTFSLKVRVKTKGAGGDPPQITLQ